MLKREETVRRAADYAQEGFLCSESVLMAIRDALGVSCECIPRVATGFAAGVGRTGNLCGAFTGAVMGLGLALGRDQPTKGEKPPYWYSKELADALKEEEGSLTCPGILGLDINDPGDYQTYRERDIWSTVCRELIRTSAGLAYDILAEEKVVGVDAHNGA